ncbi:MAG: (d)CMP kinase [Eubacteriales bacterium]|nr:(d)CMP kinase [Eubacteriales bacterium]
MAYSIAIDGPSGAGKSSVAKVIAKELGFIYVDTGAMYRAVALFLLREKIDPSNELEIKKVINKINVDIKYDNDKQLIFLNNEDVSSLIRTPEVGQAASECSVFSSVRSKLTEMQREIASKKPIVMDGRDITTTVLPNANLKIYLSASLDVRAKRRYKEFIKKGLLLTLEETKKELEERDYRDMNREISPLTLAKDAIYIDSSDMTIDEVIDKIIDLATGKKN